MNGRPYRSLCTLVAALAVAAASCGGGSDVPKPKVGEAGRPITFLANKVPASQDKFALEGRVWGEGSKHAVIFAHMFPADMDAWAPYAQRLSRKGYLTMVFNFRGYGNSDGEKDIAHIDLDLEAAVREAHAMRAASVSIVGASMGGTAAIMVAARASVAAIVTLSSPEEFEGLDARPVADHIGAHSLFVAAEGDGDAADSARALLARAPEPKQLEIIEGTDRHGSDLVYDPKVGSRVQSLIESFLAGSLGLGTPAPSVPSAPSPSRTQIQVTISPLRS